MRAWLLSIALMIATSSTWATEAGCFALDEPRSAVILSEQDVLLSFSGRISLLRLDGPCQGLTASADLWLRPAGFGDMFCGAGDAIAIHGRVCAVIDMVVVDSRGRDCFRSDRTRGWALLSLDRMRVDTREGSFEVTLSGSCPELSLSDGLRFRSNRGLREICGGANDWVLPLGSRTGPGTLLQESATRRGREFSGGPSEFISGVACSIRGVERISRR
jgi:hypothetical protein